MAVNAGAGVSSSSTGYVLDTSYADTFFRELSPAWLNYVAALHGVRPQALERPFCYLELGCGFGTSSVVHAAAFPHAEFHACDLNPRHIAAGSRLGRAYGTANLSFHQASFADLLTGPLPDFDFIVLHGVYSWVDEAARADIRRLLAHKLKPGGVVYLSYNAYPGWAPEAPLRRLLVELANSAEGSTSERIAAAVAGLQELAGLRYFKANKAAEEALASYARDEAHYLAHEFFNDTWQPFYSVDIADELSALGLTLLGSATLVDNHRELVIDDAAFAALSKLKTARERNLAADFASNRRFRRDVFVRAAVPRSAQAIGSYLGTIPIARLGPGDEISSRLRVPRGELTLQPDFVAELSATLSRGTLTIADVVAALTRAGRDASEILRNVVFAIAAGALVPCARTHAVSSLPPHAFTSACGERAIDDAIDQHSARVFPSEVLGSGLRVEPLEALALRAALAGATTLASLREELARVLGARAGAEPADVADTQIERAARSVQEDLLPTLARLGAV